MNDWRSRNHISRRDGLKAAGAILGLMAACIFVLWLIAQFTRETPPDRPPAPVLPHPPLPQPLPTP